MIWLKVFKIKYWKDWCSDFEMTIKLLFITRIFELNRSSDIYRKVSSFTYSKEKEKKNFFTKFFGHSEVEWSSSSAFLQRSFSHWFEAVDTCWDSLDSRLTMRFHSIPHDTKVTEILGNPFVEALHLREEIQMATVAKSNTFFHCLFSLQWSIYVNMSHSKYS